MPIRITSVPDNRLSQLVDIEPDSLKCGVKVANKINLKHAFRKECNLFDGVIVFISVAFTVVTKIAPFLNGESAP